MPVLRSHNVHYDFLVEVREHALESSVDNISQ